MKVEMRADGLIGIIAETGCETFALREWSARVEWNSAIDAGVRLWVDAGVDSTGESVVMAPADPMRERLARAERALMHAGFTHLDGAAEWRPPIGPHRDKRKFRHVQTGEVVNWVSDSVRSHDRKPMATYWVDSTGEACTMDADEFVRKFEPVIEKGRS